MSDDLIARLKAAHEAATPGPWELSGSDDLCVTQVDSDGMKDALPIVAYFRIGGPCNPPNPDGYELESRDTNAGLIVLLRNALPEILNALEERERMRAVVDAADHLNDAWCDAINEMDDDNIVPDPQWVAWMKAHRNMDSALYALEKSHDRLPG